MKRKGTKGLLSILDKAILNIPADDRTKEQKRRLIPILVDLPCFQRFPPVSVFITRFIGFNSNHDLNAGNQSPVSELHILLLCQRTTNHFTTEPSSQCYLLYFKWGSKYFERSL